MTFERTISPVDEPAYPATEVARMLGVPPSTIKAWAFGQSQGAERPARFRAVIDAADRRRRLLSFANLCELHVLATIRRVHRIPLPHVRDSLRFVARTLDTARPLIARQFLTNGIDLFIEHAGELLNTSAQGQQALRGGLEEALLRIEWNPAGAPVRLFPFTRSTAVLSGQPRAVVIDPTIAFGRPTLVGAGVPTAVIEDRFSAGDSPDEMAADYGVDAPQIWEAIRYERQLAAA
jgi:uncharacterized protein (DUF433 family)